MNQQVAVISPFHIRYTPEAKADILKHIIGEVVTGRSVSRVLAEDEGMPAPSQFWRWHFEQPEWQDELARARALGQEALLDQVTAIADDPEIEPKRARLMVETRFKQAQMLSPKKYGQKLDLTSGGEQLKPTQLTDNRVQALVGLAVDRKLKALKSESEDDAR